MTAVMAAALITAPVAATAADAAPSNDPFSDYVLNSTVSPSGTTIDLFNYERPAINSGKYLHFTSKSEGTEGGNFGGSPSEKLKASVNAWTGDPKKGRGGQYNDIVKSGLENGYPVLRSGKRYDDQFQHRIQEQSLAYLFNHEDLIGKKAYPNVKGLLQLDGDGYYYYDSTKNFAAFDENTNEFSVYSHPGVKSDANVRDKATGQFFPFDSASEVFSKRWWNGEIESNITCSSSDLDHFFGLTMTSHFMQPAGGMTENGKPMTFEFSGDDDVWVFIDDKLVGDIGGVHDRVGLTIDFKNGTVTRFDASSTANQTKPIIFEENGKPQPFSKFFDTSVLNEKGTFKDYTYHTIKFFYLERGAGNSNLKLKYNLVDVPASTMTKVDQLGRPVEGAVFELYAADESYKPSGAKPIASGKTAADGTFTFLDGQGVPLNFKQLAADENISHYVLKETSVPGGYRRSPDAHLRYVINKSGMGYLLSESGSYWETGVYARAEQIVSIEGDTVRDINGREHRLGDRDELFAVVYKRKDAQSNEWHAVSKGEGVDSWKVSPDAITSIDQVSRPDIERHQFMRNKDTGKLTVDITELPGLPEEYYHMRLDESSEYEYSIGAYLKTSDGKTYRLDTSTGFDRQTAAHLHVTDVANYLHIKKVDDAENPINGVTFDLYKAADMTSAEGKIVPKDNAKPLKSAETADNTNGAVGLRSNGIASIGPLEAGTYYLRERTDSVPEGYVPQDVAVRVVVDREGVHVDAGKAGDGVFGVVGVGSLIDSMGQFAQRDLNTSLYDITATLTTATAAVNDRDLTATMGEWAEAQPAEQFKLVYGAENSVLEYGPNPEGGPVSFRIDEGYGRVKVTQNAEYGMKGDFGRYGIAGYDVLGGKDLTSLFSGTSCVVMVNQREASLAVSKKVEVPEGLNVADLANKEFTFTFEFGSAPDTGYDAIRFKLDGKNLIQDGDPFKIKNGDKVVLKNGETIKVYGMPAATTYKVTEDAVPLYPQTAPKKDGSAAPAEGKVELGKTASVEFVNTYTPAPIAIAPENTGFVKHFNILKLENGKLTMDVEDGAWEKFAKPEDRTFTMRLTAVKEEGCDEGPLPLGSDIKTDGSGQKYILKTVTSDTNKAAEGNFGEIVFSKPGTYVYLVSEQLPAKPVSGITYSRAKYRVQVTATDNQGQLETKVEKRQTFGDAGAQIPDGEQQVNAVVFNNSMSYDSATVASRAHKTVTDTTGSHAIAKGEFTFGVTPLTDGAPVPHDAKGNPLPQGTGQFMGKGFYTAVNDTKGDIAFGNATFAQEHVGRHFVYRVFEVIPDDAFNENVDGGKVTYKAADNTQKLQSGWTLNGMAYDSTVFYVHVDVAASNDGTDGLNKIKATAIVREGEDADSPKVGDGSRVDFTNVHDPQDVSVTPAGQKTLEGRNSLKGEQFEFTLTPKDKATKTAVEDGSIKLGDKGGKSLAASVDDLANGQASDFSFPQITFSKPGTYTFTIAEDKPNPAAGGLMYDDSPVTLKVKVSDNKNGVLDARVTYEKNGATFAQAEFVNVYAAYGTFEGVDVVKELTGRDLKKGEFEFKVSAVVDKANPVDAEHKLTDAMRSFVNGEPAADKPNEATMKALSGLKFTLDDAGKTFSYLVDEVEPEPAKGGVTYDQSQFRIDLTVTDKGDGELAVEPAVTRVMDGKDLEVNDPIAATEAIKFCNAYAAAHATIENTTSVTTLTKKLEGREWGDSDSYTFILEPVSLNGNTGKGVLADMPMPANGAKTVVVSKDTPAYQPSGAAADPAVKVFGFTGLEFGKAGEYKYTVREQIPNDATNAKFVGKTYGNASADEKKESGWTWNGVTYSSKDATLTFKVTDDMKGQLVVTKAELDSKGVPTFTNVYASAPASIEAKGLKTLLGRGLNKDEEFTFELKPSAATVDAVKSGDVKLGDAGAESLTATVNGLDAQGQGAFAFSRITFNKAGKYAFEITEKDAGKTIAGLTYDATPVKLTVSVIDNQNGQLEVKSATYKKGDAEPTCAEFTNVYNPGTVDLGAIGGVNIEKTMTGRPIAAGEFTFNVTPEGAAKDKFKPVAVTTVGAPFGADGNTAVETIENVLKLQFGLEDVGKDYLFTFSEDNAGKTINGVTYDSNKHVLKFGITDDGHGKLTVKAYLDRAKNPAAVWESGSAAGKAVDGAVTVKFGNSYNASTGADGGSGAAAVVEANKVLSGRPLKESEFNFLLTDLKGNKVAEAKNGIDGKIKFGPISYDTAKLNADVKSGIATRTGDSYEYQYTVSEDQSVKLGGVTMDTSTYSVVVKVVDDRKGNLTTSVEYPKDGVTFTNAYGKDAVVAVALNGKKEIKSDPGASAPTIAEIAGKYTFELTAEPGAPMPEKTEAKNDAAGNIDFGKINFTVENVFGKAQQAEGDPAADGEATNSRSKTFTYTVRETAGVVAGITNDPNPKTIKVTVEDDGKGGLSAKVDGMDNFKFVNEYKTDPAEVIPTGDGALTVAKELTGRPLRPGEFEFKLVSEDSDAVIKSTNDADGNVAFPKMTFAKPGQYKYVLSETPGDLGGVTYDSATYFVTATVTDNRAGALEVAWSVENKDGDAMEGNKVVFSNEYHAAPVAHRFHATKVLTGREMKKGEFTFELLEGGKVIDTAKNSAPNEMGMAMVEFDSIEYTEAGEHDYVIREVKGNAEGVTYDEAEFTYHVAVSDLDEAGDPTGYLDVLVTPGESGEAVFNNSFKAKDPVDPEGGNKPGDGSTKPEDGSTKPGDGNKPGTGDGKPGDGILPKTGDGSLTPMVIVGAFGVSALTGGFSARKKRDRR